MRGKTLLVIAHRLSTIADADQIIVVNQGKIEATGTQAELLASCPLYQTMWEAHISVKDDGGGGVMLQTLKKFFDFCGEDNRRMFIASIWLGVVSAICSAMRIPAAAIVIQALLERNVTMATLWTSLGIIVISLIITIAINMKSTMLQTRAGYRACANKRIEIAEHLRYLPMGWFNDNSLGEVTSVTTNTMENMANVATRVVMVTTRGFLTSGIIAVMMFLFDWRMGLITLAGLLLFFAVNAAMQRAEQALSQRKFNADERLVSKVLEYVQGIAEVKNFDLTHDSATQVHGAVEEARRASFAMEIPSVLYMLAQLLSTSSPALPSARPLSSFTSAAPWS